MKKIFTIMLSVCALYSVNAQNRIANLNPVMHGNQAAIANKTQSFLCDTLHNYGLSDAPVVYTVNGGGGYVTGQNTYGDLSKAEKFTTTAGYTVQNAIIQFAVAAYGSPLDVFQVKIWDDASGLPGTQLATVDVNYATIAADVTAGNASLISFPSAVTVGSTFYLGYSFGYGAGDTIACYTNTDGITTPGTAYEEFSDNSWHAFSETPTSWGLNVSLFVLGEVCTVTGIDEASNANGIIISPNPGNGIINVAIAGKIKDASIEVYNTLGKLVYKNTSVTPMNTFTLNKPDAGVYMVKVKTDGKEYFKRIVVSK
ncbi:MAG: T9SS type A sorting domain-containing protein [Bacteroidia bacterium]